ncbi:MAG: hypothetical protein Q4G27_07555 [Flavobacteriaceae bacterium]|nr:hypothetical protein [Flavobacteriaceae bacterium]
MKELPLHQSQKIVTETQTEIVFELYLIPTSDFESEILSYNERVEVIYPKKFQVKTEI